MYSDLELGSIDLMGDKLFNSILFRYTKSYIVFNRKKVGYAIPCYVTMYSLSEAWLVHCLKHMQKHAML